MNTGEIIGLFAEQRGLNLRQLAINAEIPYNTVYAIVKRKSKRIDSETLQRIAAALGVSVDSLLGEYERGYKEGFELGVYGTDIDIHGDLMMKGYSFSSLEERVVRSLSLLNSEGQEKAAERVEELTEIPRYQAATAPQSTPVPPEG